MDQLESKFMGWRECDRRCPSPSRRSRQCRSHHSRTRIPRRSNFDSSDTSSPISYRSRPLSTCKKNGDYFNGNFDTTAFTVNINNFLIKWLCLVFENPNGPLQDHTFNTDFLNFFNFTIFFTLLYFIQRVESTMRKTMSHLMWHNDDLPRMLLKKMHPYL